jgi:hypothetical protein
MDLHILWEEYKVTWYGAMIDLQGDATDIALKKAKDILVERFTRLRAEMLIKNLFLDDSKIQWFYYPGAVIGWKVPGTKWEDIPCQKV